MKLYQRLALLLDAYLRSKKRGNTEWANNHHETIQALCKEHMPHGSGLDLGAFTPMLVGESHAEELVFRADFHHMNEHGFYDGWTEHKVKVRSSLAFGFVLQVTGRDRNGIKDYIEEIFHEALNKEVEA